ncbi:hypothetical protein M3Y94_01083200 [Aphelenchoides besseyi]|nr:hypothetical protein M3Y94_01083200 [Aphelenchoides besseyi]KAI6218814.1 hypothetical protein M3Y95_01155600 [Aphelenchoides besseyi]
MNSTLSFLLLSIFSIQLTNGIGRMQSVAIRGQLRCSNQPASGIKVKLVDHNMLLSDDTLAFADTDQNGNFYLAGHRTEISNVSPEVKILHSCEHYFEHCSKLRIPSEYVESGRSPSRAYDVGTIHLEAAADSC